MTPHREPPRLVKIEPGTRTTLGQVTWEHHPDGAGGYRPIDPSRRGDITLPCTHCGAPLVREGTREAIDPAVFGCEVCHKPSAGPDAFIAANEIAKRGNVNTVPPPGRKR